MAKTIIGVMGPGETSAGNLETAEQVGRLIAENEWVLLTGGRRAGVMDAATRGAKQNGGLTVGVLPGEDRSVMSSYVDIPILSGIGSARNNINVLSSDVVMACGVGMGTISEVLLAVKAGKHVVLLNQTKSSTAFLEEFNSELIHFVSSPSEAISLVRKLI